MELCGGMEFGGEQVVDLRDDIDLSIALVLIRGNNGPGAYQPM